MSDDAINALQKNCLRTTRKSGGLLKKNTTSAERPLTDPRRSALVVLLELEKGDAVQAVLNRVVRQTDGAGKGLCTELVYGFLRAERRVNAVLHHLLRKPEKLPREMFLALGLAVYAMLFLERVSVSATVDWAVRHVRIRFGEGLSRVANGTLRSVQRLGDAPLTEDFYTSLEPDPLRRAALFHGLPNWIAALWDAAYGHENCLRLLQRSFRQPHPCLRVNGLHDQATALRTALLKSGGTAVAEWGVAFAPGKSPARVLEYPLAFWLEQGACSWQAAGSQWALSAVSPVVWAQPIWDACAGQGGKTMALLEQGRRVSLCSDIHAGRLRGLRQEIHRLNLPLPSVIRSAMDRPVLKEWPGSILLDVPCSGLGTLARRPEIRRRRHPEDVRRLIATQRRILESAWSMLRPGGHLIYMTCSLNPEENERQIEYMQKTHAEAGMLAAWQTPHDDLWLEGMYAVLLQKKC